jgi:ribosomal protein L18
MRRKRAQKNLDLKTRKGLIYRTSKRATFVNFQSATEIIIQTIKFEITGESDSAVSRDKKSGNAAHAAKKIEPEGKS